VPAPFSRGSVRFLRNKPAFPRVSLHMPTFALEYAQEHLADLFHQARLGAEVIIIREDGQLCELTPLAEARNEQPSSNVIEIPKEPEAASGDLIPA
jgi:antitoxin (DNA-binding transcriptional repressor) of toxin-antitoxin stability system